MKWTHHFVQNWNVNSVPTCPKEETMDLGKTVLNKLTYRNCTMNQVEMVQG